MQTSRPEEPSIGDLFGRLADDAKTYVRAEADLYKAIALHRVGAARNGAIALVAAVLLLNAALVTLVVSFALGLAPVVGPVLGGLIVFAAVAVISFFLVLYGAGRLKLLGGSEEERKVLAGEKKP
ncbi:MAG TPA: phage holin family protein [Allosphingosinicella sp.]|jgi:hypothetical protein|nr:phage holin family protein [Allosphingosinicella sp.]